MTRGNVAFAAAGMAVGALLGAAGAALVLAPGAQLPVHPSTPEPTPAVGCDSSDPGCRGWIEWRVDDGE